MWSLYGGRSAVWVTSAALGYRLANALFLIAQSPSVIKVRSTSAIEVRSPSVIEVRSPSVVEVRSPSEVEVRSPSVVEVQPPNPYLCLDSNLLIHDQVFTRALYEPFHFIRFKRMSHST
jgi:hypothetical protein